ncbi:MAG: dienelactone hydrolase family protein [Chromatiales bacterium]|nr:dienelactone hydrolase family protein [Chromatiales bacterium]
MDGKTTISLTSLDINRQTIQLKIDVYRPSAPAPYPVVIDMHGCSGVVASRQQLWVERLRAWGYALIKTDGFSPRGDSNICDDTLKISPFERLADIESIINYILASDEFDHRNIFLMGMSHGATTALLTHHYPRPLFDKLGGTIAFYPYCSGRIPALLNDTLILIGGRDDWTPAEYCTQTVVTTAGDYELDIVVYPDAYHSFDVPSARGFYYGHFLLYDKAAATDSGRRVRDFLSEHKR